jgi:CRISPR-associated endoribonuclease Cas6
MRLKITLLSNKNIVLEPGYGYQLHSLIYNLLDKVSANLLHDKGFELKNRFFKLFTFSEILETYNHDKEQNLFFFPNQVNFYISSPVDWILEQIAKNGIMKEGITLGNNKTQISAMQVLPKQQITANKIKIKALTPIEVHSTLEKKDGSKKTYYYSPAENEFSQLINENLRKKWEVYHKQPCLYNIRISPVNIRHCKEKIRKFKGTVIKGYQGHYFLEGDAPLLELAFDTGLGSRNSAGFGMIEMIGKRY